jgi:hypothetical protein
MKGGQISTKAGQFLPGQFSEIQISTSTSGKNRLESCGFGTSGATETNQIIPVLKSLAAS